MDEIEKLRRSYIPARVRVLFVGESAPAGGAFFYSGAGMVYREFRDILGPHICGEDSFLEAFKANGFYLDDLVLTPINYLTSSERRTHSEASIPSLATRIAEYRPEHVISFMLGIRQYIDRAIMASGYVCPHSAVHFPGNGQQGNFRKGMIKLIPSII